MSHIPELLPYEGSWIVSRRHVAMFNPDRVTVEGAGRYLARINAEIRKS